VVGARSDRGHSPDGGRSRNHRDRRRSSSVAQRQVGPDRERAEGKDAKQATASPRSARMAPERLPNWRWGHEGDFWTPDDEFLGSSSRRLDRCHIRPDHTNPMEMKDSSIRHRVSSLVTRPSRSRAAMLVLCEA
jgi:hypothetical protein